MAHAAAPRKIGLPLAEVGNFSSLLSFAVVRHPFERLASAYFHKMVDMGHKVGMNEGGLTCHGKSIKTSNI